MASDHAADFDRISRKEHNNQDAGKTGASSGAKKLDGLATPRSNPMKGQRVNTPGNKSKLQ